MYINAKTDIGKTRTENQDNFWSAILDINGKEVGIACVCDGMGGLNDGGLASKIAVESIREAILGGVSKEDLLKVIVQANKTVNSLCNENKRMGTTCTILYCEEGKYTIYHVGDSRCYKISSNGDVVLLSNDHSVVHQYGITKENNAELYERYKSKLTNCIGVTKDVKVDTYNGTYETGDAFILCSDGFWHSFEEKMGEMDLSNLDSCIDFCINNGEKDNITISLLIIN